MPAHGSMVLFVLRKLILQTHMRSHQVGPDVWFLVGPFVYFHTLCVRTAKALARLCGCAGSHEPSLVAYVVSTIFSWAPSLVCSYSLIFPWFQTIPFSERSCKSRQKWKSYPSILPYNIGTSDCYSNRGLKPICRQTLCCLSMLHCTTKMWLRLDQRHYL